MAERATMRVVVALGAASRDSALLETAAAIAVQASAELFALFVEDLDLLNLAELPFAAEIDRTSGMPRVLDAGHIGRSMRAHTRYLQGVLDRLAEESRLMSRAQVVRGHLLNEALASISPDDLLVVGATRGTGPRMRTTAPPRRPVAVVYAGAAHDVLALQIARELAQVAASELIVLLCPAAAARDRDLARDAEELLAESGRPPMRRFRALATVADAAECANLERARVLVLSRSHDVEAGAVVASFLEKPDRTAVLAP
jgi:hypothetical protein